MEAANARIVVGVTLVEKNRLAAKPRSLGLSVGELMRRGAGAYDATAMDADLDQLDVEAKGPLIAVSRRWTIPWSSLRRAAAASLLMAAVYAVQQGRISTS